MSVIRTSLSLINFGFTIAQVFQNLHESAVIKGAGASRGFGGTLVGIGILRLVGGIIYHVLYMTQLAPGAHPPCAAAADPRAKSHPFSLSLLTAVVLLALGVVALLGVSFGLGPLG